jgi:hypothetical protein
MASLTYLLCDIRFACIVIIQLFRYKFNVGGLVVQANNAGISFAQTVVNGKNTNISIAAL